MATESKEKLASGGINIPSNYEAERNLRDIEKEIVKKDGGGDGGENLSQDFENDTDMVDIEDMSQGMESIEEIAKDPGLKEAYDILQDDERLEGVNDSIEGIKNNKILALALKGEGGELDINQTFDKVSDIYTKSEGGKSVLKKPGEVAKDLFLSKWNSESGFTGKFKGLFLGLGAGILGVLGYQGIKKNEGLIRNWKPLKKVSSKMKKYADDVADTAKKYGKTAGSVAETMREKKGSKAALETLKNNHKKQLDSIYKSGKEVRPGDAAKNTQKVFEKTYKEGMRTDPKGFERNVRMGKVPGMRIAKNALGFTVISATTSVFLDFLRTGEIGDMKEASWWTDLLKSAAPFYGTYEQVKKIMEKSESGEDIDQQEAIDLVISAGFDAAFLASIFVTGGASAVAVGAARTAGRGVAKGATKTLTKKEVSKLVGKKSGKEILKDVEKGVLKKTTSKTTSKSGIKSVVKQGRGEIMKMSLGNVSNVMKYFPGGMIFNRFFLSKQQKRFIRNVS